MTASVRRREIVVKDWKDRNWVYNEEIAADVAKALGKPVCLKITLICF